MKEPTPDIWAALKAIAERLSKPGTGSGGTSRNELLLVEQSLYNFQQSQDWESILRLRELFNSLFARDTFGGEALFRQLDDNAIQAARITGNQVTLAHLLGSRGHNLHRQGYHQEAIQTLEEAARIHKEIGDERSALKNFFMQALCFRAIGNRLRAREILNNVLSQVPSDDPFRAEPLHVLSWLEQDQGHLAVAERLTRESIELMKKGINSEILVADALADLGEIVGLLGRTREAEDIFSQSLRILDSYQGQYQRITARVFVKYSELLIRQRNYSLAIEKLSRADINISGYGHYYDLMWQVELARAWIYFYQFRWISMLRKLRSVLTYRKQLGLPPGLLILRTFRRILAILRINK